MQDDSAAAADPAAAGTAAGDAVHLCWTGDRHSRLLPCTHVQGMAWNERGAATDAIACRLASRLHLLHLVKLWLANRLPGGTAIAGKRGASIQPKRNCKWMRSNSALRVCTPVPSQPPAHLPDLCAVPLLLACLPHSLITEGLALLAERRRAW